MDSGEWAALLLGLIEEEAGNLPVSIELLTRADHFDDAAIADTAVGNLGALLLNTGELLAALEALAASEDPDIAVLAQVNLGAILLNDGEVQSARALLEPAAASGFPQATAMAQVSLGAAGCRRAARELFAAASASGSQRMQAQAQAWLGDLLVGEGDIAGAEAAYRAISTRGLELRPDRQGSPGLG